MDLTRVCGQIPKVGLLAEAQERMLIHERQARHDGFLLVVGIDEAGRGPLAGPVVAAAVSLRNFHLTSKIADSKTLSQAQRERAFHEIMEHALVGIGIMNESIIDEHNILQATFLAMRNAVHDLVGRIPAEISGQERFNKNVCLLVDGNRFKTDLPYAYRTIIGGDRVSYSIACASIVAKVIRDRMLLTYDKVFPQYGFAQHKGYPTKDHRMAILKYGLSLIHRKTFNSA